jgi:glycosyltransferase involved in cell wall biosynthesis
MTARRILVVSYYFPPSTAIGGARWAALARHLRRMGHEVGVITSAVHGTLPADRAEGVVRSGDLAHAAALRRILRRPALPAPGAPTIDTPAPRLLTRVVVPDSLLLSWMPWVLAATRRALRDAPVDCLVTTGPPDSTHLLGLALGRRRPAWIADFRDGWRFEALNPPWPTRPQRMLEARLERAVAGAADVVLGATRPIAEDFARRLGANAAWVPNAWDPDLAPGAGDARAPDVAAPGWVTLVHTGTLSGPRGRDPRPLLRALRRVNAEPGRRVRVRLVLAGRTTVDDQALLAEAGLGEAVRHVGLLERSAALALQRAADALLLLTGTHSSEATGKLFEYLAAERPILALATANEAQRIVALTATGVTVAPTDEDAIAAALRDVADGGLARAYRPCRAELERFTHPGPAHAVAELVEQAIARRAGAGRMVEHDAIRDDVGLLRQFDGG